MKVEVINSNSDDYGKEFKLRRMNYDQVVVNYPSVKGIKVFEKNEVSFITENEVDEFLIEYNDFLKIKLNRGISVSLYKALLETLQVELEIEFKSLNVLRDKYIVNKRGMWEKEIFCALNENIPVKIIATGQNFKKSGFNINIEKISEEEFLEVCYFEINKIKNEIEEKEEMLARYGYAIEKIKNTENLVKMLT